MVAFAFLALSITGILLFIKQKAHATEITHTVFGLTFVCFAIFHIINNWASIMGYSKERKTGKYQKEFLIAGSIFGIILIGGLTGILEPVAEFGRIFAAERKPKAEQLIFNKIETNNNLVGSDLKIMVEKSKETELPLVVIWVEDSTHKFIENLFLPANIATMPESEEEAREGHFAISEFKEESLPIWNSKTNSKIPNFDSETPYSNFLLNTKTTAKGKFYIVLEVKSHNKTEHFETLIDEQKGEIFLLEANPKTLLSNAFVQI